MPGTESAASRLCVTCGLCCNGVMFQIVKLQPGESPKALAALGLKVKRGAFAQPCAALDGLRCSIYADRPTRCRLFECKQLKRVEAEEITEASALAAIREVQRRVAELNGLLEKADATNPRKSISHRCATALAEPHPEELRASLALAMHELETMLDADFRPDPNA